MSESGSSPVKEGDLLAGKYRVERVLGVGGMGIVVAARHEQLEQRVAIKFVRDDALGNDEAVARFLREARAAVKLRSEHAAKVLDVGTLESGAPYMVMEYLEGADLGAILVERGPLPVSSVAEYVVQACEAVAEAHAAGIVHRDLKPQNLFLAATVGGGARVKVLDFGVSKTLSTTGSGGGALTQTRSMLGSPLYMSPEQMRSSRDVDARSDVWALGVVLFELLTRRWPYEAETMPELVLKVVTEPPQSLAELRPDVPAAMVDIVERCLKKEPGERFANAAELALALEPFAPPESRITVERARMAMGSTGRGPMVSSPALNVATAETSAPRPALTPAAWGSGKQETLVSEPKRSGGGGMWIGAGIAVAAVVGGAVFLLRGHEAPPSAATPSAVTAAVLPAATPLPTASVAPAPAPVASDLPVPSSAPIASASATAPTGIGGSSTASKPSPQVATPRAAAGPATPRAKPKGDDIPSLR
jgi:serine/threonine-protein kinase